MKILSMLEELEDTIERGINIPFIGKCLVNKTEILERIKEVRLELPDAIKQAEWVTKKRDDILMEAQQEANNAMKRIEEKVSACVEEHEITKRAQEQANEIVVNAQKNARDIRLGTKAYADSILNKVEEILKDTIKVVKTNRDELK